MGRELGRIARWRAANAERADLVNSTGRLTVATRTVLVLLGAATLGAATVAMFKHDGNVVPTAFVLVGAVFIVLGGLGRQVDSVNLKEGGLTYSQWRDEVLEEPTPEGVLETATAAPPPVQRQFERDSTVRQVTESAYEKAVYKLLRMRFASNLKEPFWLGSYRPDFVVERDGKQVLIECQFGRTKSELRVQRPINAAMVHKDKVSGVLFLTAHSIPKSTTATLKGIANKVGISVDFIRWDGNHMGVASEIGDTVELMLRGWVANPSSTAVT